MQGDKEEAEECTKRTRPRLTTKATQQTPVIDGSGIVEESITMASGPAVVSVPQRAAASNGSYGLPLTVLASLFFMWGFFTGLNDILMPHLKAVFEINYADDADPVHLLRQPISSLAAFGKLIERIGYKKGIVVGLLTERSAA